MMACTSGSELSQATSFLPCSPSSRRRFNSCLTASGSRAIFPFRVRFIGRIQSDLVGFRAKVLSQVLFTRIEWVAYLLDEFVEGGLGLGMILDVFHHRFQSDDDFALPLH